MKVNTIFKFTFPFEVWNPVVDGSNVTYVKHSDSEGHVTRGAGALSIYCPEQIGLGWVIRDLQDREGTDIQSVGGSPYDLYVVSADPVMDAFARVIGWKHTLSRSIPKTVTQMIQEAALAAG